MSDPGKVRSWIKFNDKFKDCTLGTDLYPCNAGTTVFHVDPFGGLMPCMTTLDIKYDISEARFMNGWNDIMARIRERKVDADFVCRSCDKINLCGYCPAFFRLENGVENVCSEYLCQLAGLRLHYINNYLSKGDHNGR